MRKSIIGFFVGIVGGIVIGTLSVKCLFMPITKRWCARIDNKLIDAEIRLSLLEYNHIHEDDNLTISHD